MSFFLRAVDVQMVTTKPFLAQAVSINPQLLLQRENCAAGFEAAADMLRENQPMPAAKKLDGRSHLAKCTLLPLEIRKHHANHSCSASAL
jgi:hypothetical protein